MIAVNAAELLISWGFCLPDQLALTASTAISFALFIKLILLLHSYKNPIEQADVLYNHLGLKGHVWLWNLQFDQQFAAVAYLMSGHILLWGSYGSHRSQLTWQAAAP